MAYRIATFGLAALLATTVVAQPMPGDTVVTTTCTEKAQTTVWVDQNGHPVKPTDRPAEVKAADAKPTGHQSPSQPLNYGNFRHGNHHVHPQHKPAPVPVQVPADTNKTPVTPVKEQPQPVQPVAPVKEQPKQEAPKAEAPKQEAPKYEAPKQEAPKTTTPTGGNTGGSGMGPGLSVIAGSEGIGKSIAGASGGKVGWYHNWQPNPTAGGIPGAQFCPMLHDTWGGDAGMWAGLWPAAASGGYKCYLGQNEPDLTGQDAGSVAQAFTNTFLKGLPTGDDVTIACPSFTSDQTDPNKGLGWYKNFETACGSTPGCHYNALQPHYYGYKSGSDNSEGQFKKGGAGWTNFEKFVTDVISAAKGKKVWMTEYALGPSDGSPITSFTDDERSQFIADATEYMKGKVDAYSPYTVGPGGSNQMESGSCALATSFVSAS